MRKCLIAGFSLLLASALLPACVELSDDPSTDEALAAVTDDDESTSSAEAIDPRQGAPSLAGPEASAVVIAATSYCPAGRLCLWDGAGYTGRMVSFPPRGQCENLAPYGMNDKTSSWHNHSSTNFKLYRDSSCQGPRFTAYGNTRSGQMSGYWNDSISSICGGAGCP